MLVLFCIFFYCMIEIFTIINYHTNIQRKSSIENESRDGSMNSIIIKRVYDSYSEDDGYRVLVDRLWPRGISKEKINMNHWAKEISPSTELRKTFQHNADTMEEFKRRYYFELDNNEYSAEFIHQIKDKLKEGNVTLLYAAKDTVYNHAHVLKDWMNEK